MVSGSNVAPYAVMEGINGCAKPSGLIPVYSYVCNHAFLILTSKHSSNDFPNTFETSTNSFYKTSKTLRNAEIEHPNEAGIGGVHQDATLSMSKACAGIIRLVSSLNFSSFLQ
ncbi:unnamed protein product [Cylicocyclus nassatus]|uniref:Uncharacterized protein n=1 Tax=Cylicocyclus nassatus TaxID=53992 RepID=A0AA36M632_CYLNA|nr:unnamed protein product [Cylicocyclus nassatus]